MRDELLLLGGPLAGKAVPFPETPEPDRIRIEVPLDANRRPVPEGFEGEHHLAQMDYEAVMAPDGERSRNDDGRLVYRYVLGSLV